MEQILTNLASGETVVRFEHVPLKDITRLYLRIVRENREESQYWICKLLLGSKNNTVRYC